MKMTFKEFVRATCPDCTLSGFQIELFESAIKNNRQITIGGRRSGVSFLKKKYIKWIEEVVE